jgi:SAM-dependent methyltransferase
LEGSFVQDGSSLVRKKFDDIYSRGGWGGLGSGPGSLPHNARPYVEYVANLLQRHSVRTVVDVGCGDWQMWPAGTFDNINKYVGFDIVQSFIERNRAVFQSSRYEFHVADATRISLPPGDLLLCKEVLQHLPNVEVRRFLESAIRAYRIVVVCDDIWIGSSSRWRRGARSLLNLFTPPRCRTVKAIWSTERAEAAHE